MNKHIKIFSFSIALLALLSSCSSTKGISNSSGRGTVYSASSSVTNTLSAQESQKIVSKVASGYNSWEGVAINGKMSMKGLPIDPSAKIYMERGKQLLISVRAPILGEVARIEIADGEILLLNRMKKVYARESLDKFLSKVNMSLEDVQDIFLGRIFLLRDGNSSAILSESVSLGRKGEEKTYSLIEETEAAKIVFYLNEKYQLSGISAESYGGNYTADASYNWKDEKGKIDIDLNVKADDKSFNPIFSLDAPDFSGKAMSRATIGNGWSEVSIKNFMRSF